MKPRSSIALVLVLACASLVARPVFAQKPAAKPPTPAAAATKPPPPPAAPAKWVEPVKGTAVLQVLKPDVKAGAKEIVTILKVKNMSYAPIAGLRVDEYLVRQEGQRDRGGLEADETARAER